MTKTLFIAGLLLVSPAAWAQDLGWATGPQDYNVANASGIRGYWINGAAPWTRALQTEGYAPMAARSCNPNVVAITDEYGFQYNCRGARFR